LSVVKMSRDSHLGAALRTPALAGSRKSKAGIGKTQRCSPLIPASPINVKTEFKLPAENKARLGGLPQRAVANQFLERRNSGPL
jgi:hypothetical protein